MRARALMAVLGACLFSACAHYEPVHQGVRVVPPAQGRLCLIRQQFGTTLYCCDATSRSGTPVCYDPTGAPRYF